MLPRPPLKHLSLLLLSLAVAGFSVAAQAAAAGETPRPGSGQAPVPPTGAPVLLKSEFRPGETLRYAFEAKLVVKPWVNPMFREEATGVPLARNYRAEGRFVVEFAPEESGEAKRGTLRFEGLEIKDWTGEGSPKELQTLYRQVEQSRYQVELGPYRLKFTGGKTLPKGSPLEIDLRLLKWVAQGMLATTGSDRPVAPGDRWEETPPLPDEPATEGEVRLSLPTANYYAGDVQIGGHTCAHLRGLATIPAKTELPPPPLSPELRQMGVGAKKLFEGGGHFTLLYDLDARRKAFLREGELSEARLVMQQEDPDAPVRMPITVIRMNTDATYTARLLPAEPSPEWEADLAAFEKRFESPAAAEAAPATAQPATKSAQPSLGDLARQVRQQRQSQTQPRAAQVVERAEELERPPEGFVRYAHPRGGYSLLIPTGMQPLESGVPESGERVVSLMKELEPAGALMVVLSVVTPLPEKADPAQAHDVQESSFFRGFPSGQALSRQDTTIDGKPARVTQFGAETSGGRVRGVAAFVAAPQQGAFIVACMGPEAQYAELERTCRTALDSIRAR